MEIDADQPDLEARHRAPLATPFAEGGRTDPLPGEGWGLTTAPDGLILSDGTPTLRVLDPDVSRSAAACR